MVPIDVGALREPADAANADRTILMTASDRLAFDPVGTTSRMRSIWSPVLELSIRCRVVAAMAAPILALLVAMTSVAGHRDIR